MSFPDLVRFWLWKNAKPHGRDYFPMCTFVWCEWEVKPGYGVTITLVVLCCGGSWPSWLCGSASLILLPWSSLRLGDPSVLALMPFLGRGKEHHLQIHSLSQMCVSSDVPDPGKSSRSSAGMLLRGFLQETRGAAVHSLRP